MEGGSRGRVAGQGYDAAAGRYEPVRHILASSAEIFEAAHSIGSMRVIGHIHEVRFGK
jgi:hypothetical protein